MPEVIIGAQTVAIFAGETLAARKIGGRLVNLCGVLEVWPTNAEAGQTQPSKNARRHAAPEVAIGFLRRGVAWSQAA